MIVKVLTTQNVEIDYEVASIGDRILAYIIDGLIMFGLLIGMGVIISQLHLFTWWVGILIYLPFFLYHFLCEIFMDGQSFGKKAMKIKVVKMDGSQATFGSYFLRWILRFIDSMFFIGLFVILINGKGQRLGDLAAGTTIIKLTPRISLEDALLPVVSDTYVPMFPTAINLSDRDVAIIKEVLATGKKESDPTLIRALANRIKQVIAVESPLPPWDFIHAVLKDYSYYTQG